MLRKITALLATVLCLGFMSSCSQAENYGSENNNDDTTSVGTSEAEADSESTDDTTESDATNPTPHTFAENDVEIPADKIFLNPDGKEFAYKLCFYDKDSKEPIVQYWDTGEALVKFECYPGEVFKINDHVIDCWGAYIKQIIVEDEYIIVIPNVMEVNRHPIFIYDYDGNTLFKTYYLSNSGMINVGDVTVTDNKIIIKGSRLTHGPSITIGINRYWHEEFSKYSDYLYEDTVYEYGDDFSLPRDVYLDASNEEEIKILTPNEKVSATFEMEYLGGGKFSNLKMGEYKTLGAFLDSYLG